MSASVETTCPYCGVGCGVTARVSPAQKITVSGSGAHPANAGRLCVKGTHLPGITTPGGRLSQPQINGKDTTWDTATTHIAEQFAHTIDRYGPDSIAFYLSGQLLTEDYYVANKLMKGFIGSANVDTNSRLCMASAVAAHKRAFGEDVVPCSYADLESCDLLVLAGSNAAWTHPVLYQRIVTAKKTRAIKIVVIDPRTTSTTDIADLHLALKPGSDIALFNGLLTYLVENAYRDDAFVQNHTEGCSQAIHRSTSLADTCDLTGLDRADLLSFFKLFGDTRQTVTLYSQGINQSARGTDKANAIINCHLLTGRIGHPGQGPFSITGQPNAMGGREVGGMANQLAAHMDFVPEHIDRVQRFWQAPRMARAPGLKAVELFDAVLDNRIKAIWIMGTNPAVSLPDNKQVRAALEKCRFVVVSDCMAQTDTTGFADVLLPAQGWGEKDGTVTNSERCISRQRRLIKPLGNARADWAIICDVAGKMGYGANFAYQHPAEIFAEHAALSGFENNGERLFDISSLAELSHQQYNNLAPTYWPGHRPFADKHFCTPSGKARFVSTTAIPAPSPRSPEHPFLVNSGRVRDQWHTMSRTGQVPNLFQHTPLPTLHIHPEDAANLGVESGNLINVENNTGNLRLLAEVTSATPPGNLFVPIHWNRQFAYKATVSRIFPSVVDPVSGQPATKTAAAACQRVAVKQWVRLARFGHFDPNDLNNLRGIQFWARIPMDLAVNGGGLYEFALDQTSPLLAHLPGEDLVTYVGSQGAQRYLGRCDNKAQWLAFAGPDRCRLPPLSHLADQLTGQAPDWQKLALTNNTGCDQSAMVCSCFEVRTTTLRRHIAQGLTTAAALGKRLGCGTNCGSCLPEINQLVAQQTGHRPQQAEVLIHEG